MKATKLRFQIEVDREDIYQSLQERGINPTAANVKKLLRYLETTARDAASTALVDFVRNNVSLDPIEEEIKA